MDRSPDKLVIVLRILDAINLHRVRNMPILLSASLDKNVLETGQRLPGLASTSFDSNLVWETDRCSIKRMKTENLPIKIECYTVDLHSNIVDPHRSMIGHLVLPLKSVPLIPSSKADNVKPRWYRIMGLSPEWVNQKPEVQLAVFITDTEYFETNRNKDLEDKQDNDRSLVIFTNPEPSRLGSGDGLPVRLLEERGLLQVGKFDQEYDLFLVKITLKYAKQLKRLLPEESKHSGMQEEPGAISMRYELLGDNYPCKLERKSNGTFYVQEKIVINFRTSIHSLKKYFQDIFVIRLEILFEDKIIGRSYLRFGDQIQDESLSEFLNKYRENSCTQEVEKYFQIEPIVIKHEDIQNLEDLSSKSDTVLPAIKCKFCLKYLTTDQQTIAEAIVNHQKDSNSENNYLQPNQSFSDAPKVAGNPSSHTNPVNNLPRPSSEPPEKTDIESILNCEDRDLRDIPRTFSYNLLVQSIKFNHRPPPGLWQMSLYHPRADTPLTKVTVEVNTIESETLQMSHVLLTLFFSSLPDRVLEVIMAERSKLSIYGPHGLFGFAQLDNQSLVVGTKEKQSGILILENQSSESVGMATVFSFLEEVGLNYNSRYPKSGPEVITGIQNSKGLLDDQLSYKMLEEQKQWMLQQREQFLNELKEKEVAHLAKLTNAWKRKQAKENDELMQRLEHAAALTAALAETKKNLAFQTTQRAEQEKSIEELRTKLELSYQQQLDEIREKTIRLEEELNHRSKLQTLRCEELENKNDYLTREYQEIRRVYDNVVVELSEAKDKLKDSENFRKDLEQRFQDLEKSKMFYKQQWAKMIREVHKMKLENEEHLSDLLQVKNTKKKAFRWNDDRAERGLCAASSVNEQEELERIDRLLFEERRRQQHRFPCCSSDHYS